jgi:16S rRNA (adenine1518-N6/adenine1519-N6)-dimethyltransferase
MKRHKEIEGLLATLKIAPLKRYGQNFLVDERICETIVRIAQLQKGESILEIGPGLGAITKKIDTNVHAYTSIEIDRTFHQYLIQTYPNNSTHILGNFLKAPVQEVDVLIGNLPYYATTEILEKICRDYSSSRLAVLMIQKEAVERVVALSGTDQYGPLAVMIQLVADVKVIQDVSKDAFYPEPRVVSTIFLLTFHNQYSKIDRNEFFYFVKKLFLHRRKTIENNLNAMFNDRPKVQGILDACKIDAQTRPEKLNLIDFIALFEKTNKNKSL